MVSICLELTYIVHVHVTPIKRAIGRSVSRVLL